MTTGKWEYKDFKSAFFKRTGLDLESYKDKQMERRIRQLMQRENKPDFKVFFDYLSSDKDALDRFMNYLTINTSEFFRDDKVYSRLEDEIFPELLKKVSGTIKVWSAGCSIGAEPYTVAIIMDRLKALNRVKVVATDVDEKALSFADKGCFNKKQLGKTQEDIIQRYFDQNGDEYCIKPEIKRVVAYQKHNLLSDAPVSNCHVILCRNVFIYFKPETQFFLLDLFSRSLEPGGFYIIGSAEYISDPQKHNLEKRYNTIYVKKK